MLNLIFDNSLIIPDFIDVVIKCAEFILSKRIWGLLGNTFFEMIIIMSISLIISIFLAILAYKNENLYYFINPIITIMRTMPLIMIIVLLLMSIGAVLSPYVAVILVLLPIIYESLITTFKSIDNEVIDDLKTVSDINLKMIIKFYIPLIFINIITIIIQCFGLGIKVLLMAEYISPRNDNLGAELKRFYDLNDMESVYALMILILLIVIVIDIILNEIKNKIKEH